MLQSRQQMLLATKMTESIRETWANATSIALILRMILSRIKKAKVSNALLVYTGFFKDLI